MQIHGNAPKSPITGIPGWESEAEEALLVKYASQVAEGGRILEIGSEWGRSAGAFCSGAPFGVQIISVDLFPGKLLKQHRENLTMAGFEHQTYQVVGDSHEIEWEKTAWLFQGIESLESFEPDVNGPNTAIDLLFIDGDHSYTGALTDCQRWTPFVRFGGVVIFHDVENGQKIHESHEEVRAAIDKWLAESPVGEWTLIETIDTIRVYRRAIVVG